MKRYILFGSPYEEPEGGWGDHIASFESIKDCKEYCEEVADSYFDFQIVDYAEEREILLGHPLKISRGKYEVIWEDVVP